VKNYQNQFVYVKVVASQRFEVLWTRCVSLNVTLVSGYLYVLPCACIISTLASMSHKDVVSVHFPVSSHVVGMVKI